MENIAFDTESPLVMGIDKKRRLWLACLLLAFCTFALYWPVRHYDFVQYDDDAYVFNNPTVCDGLSWWGLVWSFVDTHASNWHPLAWLSHMLDCQLFGLDAGAHHLVNVLLHSANAALLFCLLYSMTGAAGRSFAVAALFAAHPLRVESVAWISERKDVLSGFFFLLTVWGYVRYAKQQNHVSDFKSAAVLPRSIFYKLTLICFVLGLLAKPMLVTLPFILLLLDVWPLNRLGWPNAGEPRIDIFPFTKLGGLLKEKFLFLSLSAVFCLITIWAQGKAVVSAHSLPVVSRAGHALANYVSYIEKLFWPHDLAVLYLRPQNVPIGTVILAILVLVGISVLAVASFRRKPYLMIGWLWFVGMLIPVSGLAQTGLQSIADRYTYLPSIGLYLAVVWAICDGSEIIHSVTVRNGLLVSGGALLVGVCAILTRHQLACWKNTETLMNHVLETDPRNYIAHGDLGVYLSKQGRTEEALFHYQRARELDPGFTNSSTNIHNENRNAPGRFQR